MIVPAAGKLYRIAATTGATIETLDLAQPNPLQPVLLDNGTLLEVKASIPVAK